MSELTDDEISQHLLNAGVDALEGESDGTSCTYWQGWHGQLMAAMRAVIAADRVQLLARRGDKLPPRVGHILRLAEIIREVDGNHDKGAAELAEAILSHPDALSQPAITPSLDALLSPQGFYEPCTNEQEIKDRADAQHFDMAWWAPVYGCETLEKLLDQIRARILPHLRPPVEGIDVPGPDGDWADLQDLCDAEGVDVASGARLLRRARKAWAATKDQDQRVASPSPASVRIPGTDFIPTRYNSDLSPNFTIDRTRTDPERWAVRNYSMRMSITGEWSVEPRPSERSFDWNEMHSFDTALAAWEALEKWRRHRTDLSTSKEVKR